MYASACDITGWFMHLTGVCMHVLHALPHDITNWGMQLLHGLCCFDFVSDIPLLQLLCNGPVIFKWCKSKLPLKKMNGTYFKTVISLNLSKMQCSKMYFVFLMSIDFTVTINWDTFLVVPSMINVNAEARSKQVCRESLMKGRNQYGRPPCTN
jgi:hypothetical protein